MRSRIAACLALLLAAPSAHASGSSVVASYTGDTNPQLQGWLLQVNGDWIQAFNNISATGIADDLSFPVWAIDDGTPLAGVYYEAPIAYQEAANAKAAGFAVRARLRVLPQAAPIDPVDGLAGILLGDGGNGYELRLGANADTPGNGNLRILAVDGPAELEIAGGAVHHLIEIVYDPTAATVAVFVDGVERISDWASQSPPHQFEFRPAIFGSPPPGFTSIGATGEVRIHHVEVEINIPDCDDGLDDDGDGLVDLADPGCLALEDTSELDDFVCNDGMDNDGDTLVDLADPGCTSPVDEIEFHAGPGAVPWFADLSLVIEPNLVTGVPPVQIDGAGVVALQSAAGGGRFLAVPSLAGTVTGTGGASFEAVSVSAALSANTVLLETGASNTLALRGEARLCVIDPSCNFFFGLPFTGPRFATLGVGGEWTIDTGTIPARVTYLYAPWTLGTASVVVETISGSTTTPTRQGFVHGPLSLTSTLSATSGVVQLVTPMQVDLIGGSTDHAGLFATLRVRLVPEPAPALLLVAGAAAVFLLGWRKR